MTYPFICHDPYDFEEIIKREWNDHTRNYLLIDPGATFFCSRFEERSSIASADENIKKVNGIYVTTQRFVMINFNSKQERWEQHSTLYGRITKILDDNFDLIKNLHVIGIERQVKQNYKMIRMSQHIISYFIIKANLLVNKPLILEMDNKCKTTVFDYAAPKNLNSGQRKAYVKKWAEQKSYELLKARNDKKGIINIQQAAKQNDPADTVVMGEALDQILTEYVPQISTLLAPKLKKKKPGKRKKK